MEGMRKGVIKQMHVKRSKNPISQRPIKGEGGRTKKKKNWPAGGRGIKSGSKPPPGDKNLKQ